MHIHYSKYTFGDILYLKTDPQQSQRIVTDIEFCGNGSVVYYLNCGSENTRHYELELSEEINQLLKMDIEPKTESK
jgi:hypothetical protein